MNISRKTLYFLMLTISVMGYAWLAYNQTHPSLTHDRHNSVCLLKHFTNIPCPSCGSTRSVMAILNGHFAEGFMTNPLGFLLLAGLLLIPFWVLSDLLFRSDSFLRYYRMAEMFVSKKQFAVPALILITANWIWNIYKGI